jgi:hypothetical protein
MSHIRSFRINSELDKIRLDNEEEITLIHEGG